jgi:hypothetical protein
MDLRHTAAARTMFTPLHLRREAVLAPQTAPGVAPLLTQLPLPPKAAATLSAHCAAVPLAETSRIALCAMRRRNAGFQRLLALRRKLYAEGRTKAVDGVK